MNKLILMLLFAVVSNSAIAAWVQAGSNTNETAFADPATIHADGNKVTMWSLINFASPKAVYFGNGEADMPLGDNTAWSDKEQREYDCKKELQRLLYISYHSEKKGKGEIVFRESYPDSDWRPVEPDSINKKLWRIACGKN